MFQYLEERQHYEDRYDLHTIEQCLDQLKMIDEIGRKMRLAPSIKHYPESEQKRNMDLIEARMMFLLKAHRYKERESTIREWMQSDQIKQDKQDNTPPPKITCPDCDTQMVDDGSRYLQDHDDQPLRVLFIFNCPKCKKRLGAYDNGEIHVSKPNYCPDCKSELKEKTTRKGKVITTLYTCKNCGYSKKDVLDLKKSDEEHKKWQAEQAEKELKNKELLEKYRDTFCLSEKEGKEHVELLEAMEVAHEIRDEILAEFDSPTQEKLMTVKKISVTDLEKLLEKALNDTGFIRLSLGNPTIDRHVSVPFTVQDGDSKRHERESIQALHDLLKLTLKDTNWRASKDSLSYRLGFISGTLKGYESEDDLLKLFGQEKPKKPKSKLDPKLREKYEHHNYVQLTKLCAEHEAKERVRKRRLKDEPEGFFYERGESGYTCGICRRSQYSEDIWWREDGLRCRDCWRNIKEGVIPVLDLNKESWEREFLDKYDVEDRGVHPSSIRKLRREGTLVGRDLKDASGNVYWTVFLVSENKLFLDKYPSKSSL